VLQRRAESAIAATGMKSAPSSNSTVITFLDFREGQSQRLKLAWRDLRDAARLWRLCWTLSWLDIRQRYRGSILGPFWLTLSTGVMVGAMGFIYATLFRMDLHVYLPYLAVSQVLWGFLSVLVGEACTGFTSVDGMIRSVRMPFTLYGARIVLRNLVVLAHNLLVIIVVFAALNSWPGPVAFLAIPGLVIWFIDALAITVLLGALCARFRDISPIIANVMQMAFFVTPVIWKPESLGQYEWALPFNPFFTMLEIVRGPLLDEVPSTAVYLSAGITSVLLILVSCLMFARVRGRIAFWV
jgi:lipopolysaccharide transport system permease protein